MRLRAWLGAIGAMALAGNAYAQDPKTGERPTEPAPPGQGSATPPGRTGAVTTNQLTGELQSIDRDRKTLTIDQAGQTQLLKLDDRATVFLEGRLGSFEDLKEGQQVRAAFEEKEGTRTLRWIEVNPKPAPARPAPAPVPPERGTPGDAPKAATGPGKAATEAKNELQGQVVTVDPDKSKLVLGSAGKLWTIDVARGAPVLIEGRDASLEQLREGQQVRASLDPTKATTTATRIETVGGPTKKHDGGM